MDSRRYINTHKFLISNTLASFHCEEVRIHKISLEKEDAVQSVWKRYLYIVGTLLILDSSVLASSDGRGQRMFDQNIKKACGLNGIMVARSKTQSEWTSIYEENRLNATMLSLCPEAKPFKEIYLQDVYAYMKTYAKDSGVVLGAC